MTLLAGLAGLLTAAGIAYLVLAAVLVRRYAARPPDPPAAPVPVTVLKPLHGAEPGLLDNLLSLADDRYPGPVQVVLGVADEADGALPVARAFARMRPALDVAIVVDGRRHGANAKVSNLINMAERAKHDVLVLADSDIRVGPGYLGRLAAALERPGVGAATCLYHGVAMGGLRSPSPLAGEGGLRVSGGRMRGRPGEVATAPEAREGGPKAPSSDPASPGHFPPRGGKEEASLPSRLSALAIDSHFLPGVVTGVTLGLAKPCMGSTIALRRGTLERAGGFRALADALADDYELGAAVRRLGLAVVVPPFTVGHVCAEGSLRALVAQELRWQRTIRLVDPAGHAGSAVAHPLPFALLAVALAPGAASAALLFTAIAARIGLRLAVARAFGLQARDLHLVPARDLLSAAIFAASFAGRGVSWRGRSFDVERTGAMRAKAR